MSPLANWIIVGILLFCALVFILSWAASIYMDILRAQAEGKKYKQKKVNTGGLGLLAIGYLAGSFFKGRGSSHHGGGGGE